MDPAPNASTFQNCYLPNYLSLVCHAVCPGFCHAPCQRFTMADPVIFNVNQDGYSSFRHGWLDRWPTPRGARSIPRPPPAPAGGRSSGRQRPRPRPGATHTRPRDARYHWLAVAGSCRKPWDDEGQRQVPLTLQEISGGLAPQDPNAKAVAGHREATLVVVRLGDSGRSHRTVDKAWS